MKWLAQVSAHRCLLPPDSFNNLKPI